MTENNGTITYVYDATGSKLEKRATSLFSKSIRGAEYTQYAGNFVYLKKGNLESPYKFSFFSQPEGYVERNGADYDYVYQYKDHLGNIRLSYKNAGTTSTPNLEIIEENNYYPFACLPQAGLKTLK